MNKADKIQQLMQQGIEDHWIAERLGVHPAYVRAVRSRRKIKSNRVLKKTQVPVHA